MELTKAERGILMSALGRIGGKARAKALGPERVKSIALKASKAAKKAAAIRRSKKTLDGKEASA